MGNLQRADRVDDHREGEVGTVRQILLAQARAHRTKDTEDLRPIKALTFAVLTDAHDDLSPFSVATDASYARDWPRVPAIDVERWAILALDGPILLGNDG